MTAVEWLFKETLGITLQLENRMISHRNWELQMVELFKQAKEMEKQQIVIAEIETLRVIEKYGISSIEPLINELKNQIKTFKSE
jgi:hypothetical protein